MKLHRFNIVTCLSRPLVDRVSWGPGQLSCDSIRTAPYQVSRSSCLFFWTARTAALQGILRCEIGAVSSLWVLFQFFLFKDCFCTCTRGLPLFGSNLMNVQSIHTYLGKSLNSLFYFLNCKMTLSFWSFWTQQIAKSWFIPVTHRVFYPSHESVQLNSRVEAVSLS